MLAWKVFLFITALFAAVFGYSGIAGDAAGFAKVLLFVILVLFIAASLMGNKTHRS